MALRFVRLALKNSACADDGAAAAADFDDGLTRLTGIRALQYLMRPPLPRARRRGSQSPSILGYGQMRARQMRLGFGLFALDMHCQFDRGRRVSDDGPTVVRASQLIGPKRPPPAGKLHAVFRLETIC